MQSKHQSARVIETERVHKDLLASVVEEVRMHAHVEPAKYLEDSVVPEGGE